MGFPATPKLSNPYPGNPVWEKTPSLERCRHTDELVKPTCMDVCYLFTDTSEHLWPFDVLNCTSCGFGVCNLSQHLAKYLTPFGISRIGLDMEYGIYLFLKEIRAN